MKLSDLQTALFAMQAVLDTRESWIITVFPDGDARVHGDAWAFETAAVPTMWMSDDLYALYCASEGKANKVWRKGKG